MIIKDNLARQGAFLFRWRSYLPLVLLFPAFVAFSETAHLEEKLGEPLEDFMVLAGLLISFAGLAVRWITIGYVPAGTSGRNTQEQRAEALNTDGMYSIVRNPLYLGNFLAIAGVLVSLKVWWLMLIGGLVYWLYIERIIAAEEEFLIGKYGETCRAWADKTPVFIPDFRLWRKSSMNFSVKNVLRREYNGFMAVCAAFFVTEVIVDIGIEREPFSLWLREDWLWVWGFGAALAVYLVLRTLKKHTSFLKVEGR